MKHIKLPVICFTLLSVIISFAVFLAPPALAVSDPEIKADAVMLYEVGSQQMLYGKNEEKRIYPASTTKIMTVYLACEAIDNKKVGANDLVTISDNIYFDIDDPDSSSQGLTVGEQLTLTDLLHCALISSANESCNAIAEYIAGDCETFVKMMNDKAKELGCTDTHFVNAHGLYDDNHYTTAHDLCRIINQALTSETYTSVASKPSYLIPANEISISRNLTTTNKLIDASSTYYYEYATGGKTGYLSAAGNCLVSTAEKDDISLISVVMNAEEDPGVEDASEMRFSESRRLFEWGFSNFSYRVIVSVTDLTAEIPVLMGEGSNSVVLRPEKDLYALLDNEIDLSSFKYDTVIYSRQSGEDVVAPVSSGEVLGEITPSYGGKTYETVKLVANTSVGLAKTVYIKAQIKELLAKPKVKLFIFAIFLIIALYIAYIIYYTQVKSRKRSAASEKRKKEYEDTQETIKLKRAENEQKKEFLDIFK